MQQSAPTYLPGRDILGVPAQRDKQLGRSNQLLLDALGG
jgi:hypothetical protein